MDQDGSNLNAERTPAVHSAQPKSAEIILFPVIRRPEPKSSPVSERPSEPSSPQPKLQRAPASASIHTLRQVDHTSLAADLIALIARSASERPDASGPTTLGALGAVAGFAAQQSLLLRGPALWHQPMRAAHLDRILVSADPADMSLWHQLKAASATHRAPNGANQLPDPKKLLAVTQKCIGTNQFGVITLPPAHRLAEQPQTGLIRLWARVRDAFDAGRIPPEAWPVICNRAAAAAIAGDLTRVPLHVAVRIIMQAALAMALVEPRQIPGASVKSA